MSSTYVPSFREDPSLGAVLDEVNYSPVSPRNDVDLNGTPRNGPAHPTSMPPPPEYESIRNHSESATAAAERNREKQVLRDQLNASGPQQSRWDNVPHIQGPASVEPSDSGSGSEHHPHHLRHESNGGGGLQPRPGQTPGQATPSGSGSSNRQRASSGSRNGNIRERQLTAEEVLPPGMDVQEALTKCSDPSLSWSLQFWVTIADPEHGYTFFANPATGQCSWEPPQNCFVVPRQSSGEWWELADRSRKNRSYYYNTLTKKTQWTRPTGTFVIPLGMIQSRNLAARPSLTHLSSHGSSSQPGSSSRANVTAPLSSPLRNLTTSGQNAANSPESAYSVRPTDAGSQSSLVTPVSGQNSSSSRNHQFQTSPAISPASSKGSPRPWQGVQRKESDQETVLPPLQKVSSPEEIDDKLGKPVSAAKRLSTAFIGRFTAKKGEDDDQAESSSSAANKPLTLPEGVAPPRVTANLDLNDPDVPRPEPTTHAALPKNEPAAPIPVDHSRAKSNSAGLLPALPAAGPTSAQDADTDEFAKRFFATKRTGLMRSRITMDQLMEWQRAPISSPLLLPSKNLQREAVTTFKVIQHVMGERERPVEAAKPAQPSSGLSIAGLSLHHLGKTESEPQISRGSLNASRSESELNEALLVDPDGKDEKMIVLEEIRWMLQVGVIQGEMRDEIYAQVIKQATNNADQDATVLAFQLFCVLVNAFAPTKDFEPFVRQFFHKHISLKRDGLGVMSKYCLTKLDITGNRGGLGKVLTVGEIEHASDAAFYPSVYGESLSRIMALQSRSYPELKVPVVLPFLGDGILALNGLSAEGIFRVPGDADTVSELKSRMDRGHYQLKGISDPHVAASLFKLWLRELEEPIIPSNLYNEALKCANSPAECVEFVRRLPVLNKRVLLFVVSFVQLFLKESVTSVTKMNAHNMALVLAPNLLRTTSDSLVTVFTNANFESKFVLQLLENLSPKTMDPEYIPKHGGQAASKNVSMESVARAAT